MIAIIEENPDLWPKQLKWDTDPMVPSKKPNTKTLIRVIMEKYNDMDDRASSSPT